MGARTGHLVVGPRSRSRVRQRVARAAACRTCHQADQRASRRTAEAVRTGLEQALAAYRDGEIVSTCGCCAKKNADPAEARLTPKMAGSCICGGGGGCFRGLGSSILRSLTSDALKTTYSYTVSGAGGISAAESPPPLSVLPCRSFGLHGEVQRREDDQ